MKPLTVKNMARVFARILLLPRDQRVLVCTHLNEVLDDLRAGGWFGPASEIDPRRSGR